MVAGDLAAAGPAGFGAGVLGSGRRGERRRLLAVIAGGAGSALRTGLSKLFPFVTDIMTNYWCSGLRLTLLGLVSAGTT